MARYNVMTEEAKILVNLLRLERSPDGSRWGVKRIMKEFPNKNWKFYTIKRLIKKIDATGDIKRIKGSGRPRSARNEETIRERITCTQPRNFSDESSIISSMKISGVHI